MCLNFKIIQEEKNRTAALLKCPCTTQPTKVWATQTVPTFKVTSRAEATIQRR